MKNTLFKNLEIDNFGIDPKIPAHVQPYIQSYSNLSDLHKSILHLIALAYFDLGFGSLQECVGSLRHFFPSKDHFPNNKLTSAIQSLHSKKFLSYYNSLVRPLDHFLTLQALKSPLAAQYLEAINMVSKKQGRLFYRSYSEIEMNLNQLRLALYMNQDKNFNQLAQNHTSEDLLYFFTDLFLGEPLELDWVKERPILAQQLIARVKLHGFCTVVEGAENIQDMITYYGALRDKPEFASLNVSFLPYDILSGNLPRLNKTLTTFDESSPGYKAAQGTAKFLSQQNEHDNKNALTHYDDGLKTLRKLTGTRSALLGQVDMPFYILAIFRSRDPKLYKKIQTFLDLEARRTSGPLRESIVALQNVLWKVQGQDDKVITKSFADYKKLPPLVSAIVALADFWLEEEPTCRVKLPDCEIQFEKYKETLPLVAKVFAEILEEKLKLKNEQKGKVYQEYLNQDRFKGIISFLDCIQMGEVWERKLDILDGFFFFFNPDSIKSNEGGAKVGDKRLVWHFNPESRDLEAIEQSALTKGRWSKGRTVSLKRIYDSQSGTDLGMDIFDKSIAATLRKTNGWSYPPYAWSSKTPLALIGHPRVYHMKHLERRLEFVSSPPELVIKEIAGDKFHISLSHAAENSKVFIEPETPSLYRIIEFPKSLLPLVDILGHKGLTVPSQSKDHVLSLIQKASPVLPIHSEIEAMDVTTQKGDPTPCFQLVPLEPGLKLNLFVRPFEDKGPYFRPGHGRPSLSIYLNAQAFKASRDLAQERKNADALIDACPSLRLTHEGTDEWIIEDPQDCLEALEELQAAQEPLSFKLEWPEGQKLALSRPRSFEHLSLKIKQQGDWFEIKGDLKIDEDTVIDFQRLLKLLSTAEGRFIPLETGKYISLTNHLKKQLQELQAFAEDTSQGTKVHSFASFSLKNLADNTPALEGDKGWKQKTKTFKDAEAYHPKLPTTLQADLRDYQQTGFEWISRLSYLGMGACLADDMGLGKTLQALAVMLNHAPQGPCLVIAPTSVCHNWVLEIEKFAPALKAHSLSEHPTTKKRKELIESLKPMDVLICSYSLLQQEIGLLTAKEAKPWQMIVLDEAQAIKNATTKRFQAAISLKGHFKLALTGTPIENSLEEIWSLFRFITPGLLGSFDSFRKRFLSSSETGKDTRQALKSVVKTFILRRTKSTVLQELPPRTEQTLFIDMSAEESSFYEALRRQALTNIANLDETQSGQKKIHILAEITRLRQACCHPRLAQKEITLASSKLKAFSHLVDDLLQNNHQALVFSQYVGYLSLVRETLDEKKIAYQYLDGSTPAAERKKQIQAFQEGRSPLFLLSLKAGGSGLNLTAADYVIHLDPWWNPAVEDQASDRAHRLGQTRPVTIYRLIMQNTIEERILGLHKTKRDLASDLLEGTNMAQKMTEDDLIQLIKGNV